MSLQKFYQDTIIVMFTASAPVVTLANHNGALISSLS